MAKRRSRNRNRRRQQREYNINGCGNQVLKCLRGFQGVEGIEIDDKNHKVIVKGKKADPIKVSERLRKKSGKHVELIAPKPIKEEIKEEKKPEPQVIEVVLKIYLHCEGCAKDVKHCIHDMEGVQTVDPDMEKNLVTVKGTMDAQKLVEFVSKRGGRHAEIVKQSNHNGSNDCDNEGNKNETREESCIVVHNYPTDQLVYAPQLFSDENPNSCSVM
ncbi:Heavy metal-associated isoprenylated plant protein 7 [Sesamum alatum]|uniref:Heavy metal-associated isoprenylated plant protein 7 n=1 Tax=Sesamum alatum TaxID=300844 RepID=A0AAE2C8Z3_9LAMI|nr:Heavy metal-associated isoprenylated plant protein 7 [Sesamum alatum]